MKNRRGIIKDLPLPSCPPTPDGNSKKPKREKVKLTAEQKTERRVQAMKAKQEKLYMQLEEQQVESKVFEEGGPKAVSLYRRWRAALRKAEMIYQRLKKTGVSDLIA